MLEMSGNPVFSQIQLITSPQVLSRMSKAKRGSALGKESCLLPCPTAALDKKNTVKKAKTRQKRKNEWDRFMATSPGVKRVFQYSPLPQPASNGRLQNENGWG